MLPPLFPGLLVNLHHSSASSSDFSDPSSPWAEGHCGAINTNLLQQVVAAKWATDVINNQSLPYELRIGTYIEIGMAIIRRNDLTGGPEKLCSSSAAAALRRPASRCRNQIILLKFNAAH